MTGLGDKGPFRSVPLRTALRERIDKAWGQVVTVTVWSMAGEQIWTSRKTMLGIEGRLPQGRSVSHEG